MFYVYLLKCSDGTFYTGYTNDVKKRLEEHSKALGAKYTRGRLPVKLQGVREFRTQREAMQAEILVKTMSREEKMKYFSTHPTRKS